MRLERHREIQELLVDKILRFLGVIVVPVLLINLSRYLVIGWLFSFNFYILATLLILAVSFNVTRLSYPFKVSFLLFLFFSLAVSTGLNFGMVSFMTEFLLLTIFLSVVFLRKKDAVFIFSLCGLLCAGFAVLCIQGALPLVHGFEQHVNSIPSWASFLATFLLMASIVILIAGDIGNLLAEKLEALEEKNAELVKANQEVRRLQGILPICSRCKSVRDDKGYWYQVESYIESHSDAKFSHSLCEDCTEKLYGGESWYRSKRKETNEAL